MLDLREITAVPSEDRNRYNSDENPTFLLEEKKKNLAHARKIKCRPANSHNSYRGRNWMQLTNRKDNENYNYFFVLIYLLLRLNIFYAHADLYEYIYLTQFMLAFHFLA